MFTNFYCTLELRSELRQAHRFGERILILYHARARREWFALAKSGKSPFDISVIEDDWMTEAHKEMWDNVHMQEIRNIKEEVMLNSILQENLTLTTLSANFLHSYQTLPTPTASHFFFMLHRLAPLPHLTVPLPHTPTRLTASCFLLLQCLMPQPLRDLHFTRSAKSSPPPPYFENLMNST